MDNYYQLSSSLLQAYDSIFSKKECQPTWAVRKIMSSEELVRPTIPFVGKRYAEQDVKILIYASAENLADYWNGNAKNNWTDNWLDDDERANNRHRSCFDDETMQHRESLPYVHCGPMEGGALLTAAMYLAYKLRNGIIDSPYEFYETVAFANYGKFSIETEIQRIIRNSPSLTDEEKLVLVKDKCISNSNKDYAKCSYHLQASGEYVKSDITILRPDYIIMPSMNDNGLVDSVKGKAKIIQIYQMMPTVINNMGINGKNNPGNQYSPRNIQTLPHEIQEAYTKIHGINHEKYRFVFDHLDKCIEHLANQR